MVAGLFVVVGVQAAWEIGSNLRLHYYNLNFALLGLAAGIGLLRLRRGWRVAAIIVVWLPFVMGAVLGLLIVFGGMTIPPFMKVTLLGRELTGPSRVVFGIASLMIFPVLLVWMYRVLTNDRVKEMFEASKVGRPWIEWAALPAAVCACFVLAGLTPKHHAAAPQAVVCGDGVFRRPSGSHSGPGQCDGVQHRRILHCAGLCAAVDDEF